MRSALIPAAQYLRMSTDYQEYSLDNQAAAIERYADAHGFTIVKTYEDAGKSGLNIGHRSGLKALLTDILGGKANFKATLVYDVSRWGRFQDADEAAHYEFLCKSSGIRIYYCAEEFGSDDTLSNRMMKALKRTMAAEFSRELSARVFAGKRHLAEIGFHEGGPPGYGLRRLLIGPDRRVKQELRRGELKSISTEHVILAPGSDEEQKWVRWIYAQFNRGVEIADIAKELNLRGIPWIEGKRWNRYGVRQILTNRKYAGWNVWAVWSQTLRTRYRRNAPEHWVMKEHAFKAVVDQHTFERAQRMFASKTYRKSNEMLLRDVARLWKRRGWLSESLLDRTRCVPSCSTLRHRFGSMKRVYELIGFEPDPQYSRTTEKSSVMVRLRSEILSSIQKLFGSGVRLVRENCRHRYKVELPQVGRFAVVLCRSCDEPNGLRRWLMYIRRGEHSLPALVCLMTPTNDAIEELYAIPSLDARTRMTLTPKDPWLRRGIRLRSLAELGSALQEVQTWVPLGSIYRGFSNLTTQLMGPARTHIHDNERHKAVQSARHESEEVRH